MAVTVTWNGVLTVTVVGAVTSICAAAGGTTAIAALVPRILVATESITEILMLALVLASVVNVADSVFVPLDSVVAAGITERGEFV